MQARFQIFQILDDEVSINDEIIEVVDQEAIAINKILEAISRNDDLNRIYHSVFKQTAETASIYWEKQNNASITNFIIYKKKFQDFVSKQELKLKKEKEILTITDFQAK